MSDYQPARVQELDELCEIAAHIFKIPVSYLSLLTADTQSLRAAHGIDLVDSPSDQSICSQTVLTDQVLIVADAQQDPRFRDLSFVKERGVRFYAGAPIHAGDDLPVGSACLIDSKPRSFTQRESELLQKIARIAGGLLRENASAREAETRRAESEQQKVVLAQQSRELWRQHRMMAQSERLAQVGSWELPIPVGTVAWSDEVYRITEVPVGTPMPLDRVITFLAPAEQEPFARALEDLKLNGEPIDVELEITTLTGRKRWVHVVGERELVEGAPTRLFGMVHDVTERRLNEDRLWQLARHDALTGLPNRTFFEEQFQIALDRASSASERLAALFLDLDRFKEINDTCGHPMGDRFLQEVGRRLRKQLRGGDFVGRLGGDEFAIILGTVSNADEAKAIGERLLIAVSDRYDDLGERLQPSASLGVALFPDHGRTAEELMQCADLALYDAKGSGRSRVHVFDPNLRTRLEERLDDAAAFRRALIQGRIEIHYQPQYRLSDMSLIGFEALARWRQDDGSFRSAGEFRTALEDRESVSLLGEVALRDSIEILAAWRAEGLSPCQIAVNASSAELHDGSYPERVIRMLSASGVPPECLQIEITESVLLDSGESEVQRAIGQLHRNGVQIALDDFGTGYASLTHLKRYPIDQIKIDRSFIADLKENDEDEAIVRAMIGLARSLGIETVAEGVEAQQQLSCLQRLGCEYVQGFLFARALPPDQATTLLRRSANDS